MTQEDNGDWNLDGTIVKSVTAQTNFSGYTYSDGSAVTSDSTVMIAYEPIKWQIVSTDEDSVLLISKEVIDSRSFSNSLTVDANYSTSELREWLNGEFYESVFPADNNLLVQTIENDNGQSTTYDKVTIPTASEMSSIRAAEVLGTNNFLTGSLMSSPSDYALARGAQSGSMFGGTGVSYWTRTHGTSTAFGNNSYVKYIDGDGNIQDGGTLSYATFGVRPMIRVSKDSDYYYHLRGLKPIVNMANMSLVYGGFPQSVVTDSDITAALDDMYTAEGNATKVYECRGKLYYPYSTANFSASGPWKFLDGTVVNPLTKYWFDYKPIEWKIFRAQMMPGSRTVCAYSKYAIAGVKFGSNSTYIESNIDTWLNNTFLDTAFMNGDYSCLESNTLTDNNNSPFNRLVYLFSRSELLQISDNQENASDPKRVRPITDFAIANLCDYYNGNAVYCYTRDAYSTSNVYVVDSNGIMNSSMASNQIGSIVPVIKVDA